MSNISTGRRPDPSPEMIPSFSRRSLLGGLAVSAAVAAPVAAGALAAPEIPIERINRLGAELVEALNAARPGRWKIGFNLDMGFAIARSEEWDRPLLASDAGEATHV